MQIDKNLKSFLKFKTKWIFSALSGFYLFIILSHGMSSPTNNYFAYIAYHQYFLLILLAPGIIGLLITGIFQKFVNSRYLLIFWLIVAFFSGIWFMNASFNFEMVNSEHPMYVFGYLVLFQRNIYSFLIGSLGILVYLSLYLYINDTRLKYRESALDTTYIIKDVMKLCFIINLNLLIGFLLMKYNSVSVALLYFIIVIGITFAVGFREGQESKGHIDEEQMSEAHVNEEQMNEAQINEEGNNKEHKITIFSNSIAADLLVFITALFSLVLLGFLYPIDSILLSDIPESDGTNLFIYTTNPPNLLDSYITTNLLTLALLSISFLAYDKYSMKKKATSASNEKLILIKLTLIMAVFWLTIMSSSVFTNNFLWFDFTGVFFAFNITPTELFVPISLILIFLLGVVYLIKRERDCIGLLWILSILSIFFGWIAFQTAAYYNLGASNVDVFNILFLISILIDLLLAFGLPKLNKRLSALEPSNVSVTGSINNSNREKLDNKKERGQSTNKNNKSNRNLIYNKNIRNAVIALYFIAIIVFPVSLFLNSAINSQYQLLANFDNTCIFYLADTQNKIDPNFKPNFGMYPMYSQSRANNTIMINAAKNEYESAQVVMLPIHQKFMAVRDISFSGFQHKSLNVTIDKSNLKVYIEKYMDNMKDMIPDPLEGFHPFTIYDTKNHPLWFTFYIPKNSTAGEYTGTIDIKTYLPRGSVTKVYYAQSVKLDIQLNVFNFSLPEISSLKSDFGYSGYASAYNKTMEEFQEHRMMKWVRLHAPKFNVSADGSVDYINFTELDKKIYEAYNYGFHSLGIEPYREGRLFEKEFVVDGKTYNPTNFTSYSGYNKTFAQYTALFEQHLKDLTYTNEFGESVSVFSDCYFAGFDEIGGQTYEALIYGVSEYRIYKNGFNMTLPIMQTMMHGNELLESIVDIICYHPDGEEPDFIRNWREAGKEVWIYTTGGPRFPVPTISTFAFQAQVRGLGWMCWLYNYTHYLIWDTTTRFNGRNGEAYEGWNGGQLLYEDSDESYLISLRMEQIRDGFEDFDYFKLLNDKLIQLKAENPTSADIAKIESIQNRIKRLMNNYEVNMNDYIGLIKNIRVDIGNLLTNLNNN